MTIITTQSRVTYAGDNVSTLFPIPFEFFLNSDITAVKTAVGGVVSTLVQGTDYSLSGAGVPSGGSAAKTSALLTGETMALFLNPPVEQQSHYPSNNPFPAATLENDLDRQTQISQRLADQLSRSLRAPDADPAIATAGFLLPSSIQRAGTLLGFDVNGNPTIAPSLATVLTQAAFNVFLAASTPYLQTPSELAAGVTPTNFFIAPYNVLRYGADPAGVADSTAAFQAALNSVSYLVAPTTQVQTDAQGGQVYVPRGLYIIKSTLYINSNVHLVGEDCGQLQQSPLVVTGSLGGATILYQNPTLQSIAIDASGFWTQPQTAYGGTATAGAASTITITTGLTINTNGGAQISITAGTGAGQTIPVSAYNSGTGLCSVAWPWATPPNNTSVWSIAGHTIGQRMTQFISAGEGAIETFGLGTFVQAPAIKNINVVSQSGHYMGLRMAVTPQGVVDNVLTWGFQVGLEAVGCGYALFKNIISASQLIGFAWVQSDHVTRENCMCFSINATASPITPANAPWFVRFMVALSADPNLAYFTAHYIAGYDAGGCFITCDGEGGDRSYFAFTPRGTVFLGCHMERFTHVGYYQNSGTAMWVGGDWNSTNTAPAFDGISHYLTVDSFSADTGMGAGAVTFGPNPNTFGGRVTVRNVLPQGGDSAPVAGSLVTWDAFPKSIAATTLNTVGAATLTAGVLYGGAIVRGGAQVGAFSDTTATAASLIAQFIPVPIVGSSFQCTIYNTTGQAETLLAGTGVTFQTGTIVIAAGASRVLTIVVGNIGTPAVNIFG